MALDDNQVIGFAELLHTPRPPINRPDAAELEMINYAGEPNQQ
ncbi:hypothetical protein [Bifidobacterium sp. UTCIF-37]